MHGLLVSFFHTPTMPVAKPLLYIHLCCIENYDCGDIYCFFSYVSIIKECKFSLRCSIFQTAIAIAFGHNVMNTIQRNKSWNLLIKQQSLTTKFTTKLTVTK